ncbi:FtsH protease activity modulator HflK [Dyella sp.]|jgi:membrane protease subunit HflK|uniref:FtsH protease activity modulator HflK n=1 Tax=Dyella sp. TaxID=1869338 RepID=UPI002D79A5DF|nr:FtsH protease activity modulator HflK [Dyella sp.]HET6432548.1 FtsH protease activity modulator HflK [Dyella sp.]
MAWNEPGNGQRDPWGKNRQNGSKPNVDQFLKSLRARFGRLGSGGGGIFTIVLALLLAVLLLSSYTIINTSQAGVVLRFGQYTRTLSPGFHFKLPAPIETVNKVETTRIRSMSDQVRMLTSDENIIAVNFNVQYQVSDARRYLFSTSNPEDTLAQAAEAAVRSVVGAHSMDDILTSPGDAAAAAEALPAGASSIASAAPAPASKPPAQDRVTLQQQTRDALQRTLDSYNAGLIVTDVSFQNVAPPQEVKAAFDDVNAAREDKQSSVNKAYAYANQIVPQATGKASRIAAQADGYKAERIARATGDAERFNLLLKEYKAAPEVTRQRLWLETMEQVMATNPKVVDGSGGRNIINLPLGQSTNTLDSGTTGAGVTVTGDATTKESQP